VVSVAVTPDGSKIVSGSKDNTIKIWDLGTGQCLRTLTGHTDIVWSVALTPDGTKIVSGSDDKTIKVWDLKTGALLRTLTGHTGPVESVAVSPDGSKIASGSGDETLKVWDLNTGALLGTLTGHPDEVNSVAVTRDGSKIVSGCVDGTIDVWRMPSASNPKVLQFSYQGGSGNFVRRMSGTVADPQGLWKALAPLRPPPGAHGDYGLLGDDGLLGKEPGYGLRQLGAVARKYLSFDTFYFAQPTGWENIGVQAGVFTDAAALNDTSLGWAFFDVRGQFETDLKRLLNIG
jgi:tricorn protease-like protein